MSADGGVFVYIYKKEKNLFFCQKVNIDKTKYDNILRYYVLVCFKSLVKGQLL